MSSQTGVKVQVAMVIVYLFIFSDVCLWFFPFLYDFVFLFVLGCYGVYMMIVSLPGDLLMYS
jgi:hypothetical protein